MSITLAYDVTAADYPSVPAGQRCGYTTGSGDIVWTAPMWATNPGAVRIDQDVAASDGTADILDVEGGAATFADCPGWVKRARASFAVNTRPGQRQPAIYFSASNAANVANALLAGGVTGDVGLWIADWNLSEAAAIVAVTLAAGPFPIVGIQFSDLGGGGSYDLDVFSQQWLAKQSGVVGNTVVEGSSGPAVSAAQIALNARVSPKLSVDGLFGQVTLAAVRSFQTLHGLTVDGVVGPATWKILEPTPPDPKPTPTATSSPSGLKTAVKSTAAAGTFSWIAVPGVAVTAGYHFQLEWWKPGFGWVLSCNETVEGSSLAVQALAPQSQYRWRVAANTTDHIWSDWQSFKTV
jgi:hypothetical protein